MRFQIKLGRVGGIEIGLQLQLVSDCPVDCFFSLCSFSRG